MIRGEDGRLSQLIPLRGEDVGELGSNLPTIKEPTAGWGQPLSIAECQLKWM